MRKNMNRGVTIAEAMVAMLIILVVSASAVTMITAYSKQSAAMLQRSEVLTIAENTLECFKVADSYTEFVQYLPFATDYSFEVVSHQTSSEHRRIDPSDPLSEVVSVTVSETGSLTFHDLGYSIRITVLYEESRASYNMKMISDKGDVVLEIEDYLKTIRAVSS